MDFSGRSARILAWKVTGAMQHGRLLLMLTALVPGCRPVTCLLPAAAEGDMAVPAGRLAFIAQAAPLAQPWPAAEHDLIAEQAERWLEEEQGGWEDDNDAGRGQVQAVHPAWAQEGPLPPPGVPDMATLAEARLWAYSEDRLALCWVDSAHADEMRRIDAELRVQ